MEHKRILPTILIGITTINLLSAALSFDGALQKTLIQSYVVQSSLNEIERCDGERVQCGLFLNPIFSYSVENVLGNKCWKGWESAESRYEIAQAIQVAGQRKCKTDMARFRLYSAQYQHSYLEIRLANELKKSFLDVCRAQEILSLAIEFNTTSVEVNKTILAKSEGGKVSPIEIKKSKVALANSELDLQKACVSLEVAQEKLASFWGGCCSDFDCLEYPYFQFDCPPSYEECNEKLCFHPLILKTQFDQLAAEAECRLERAQCIPDVIVTAGYKTIQNSHNRGMVLGIAFPLPIFDRNQGNVCRAAAQECGMLHQYLDTQIALQTRLSTLHKEVMQLYSELIQVKTVIVSLAEETYEAALEGYRAGKYEYMDLLDSQKMLFEAKERYIEALSTFFKKQTDIEYLTL